MSVKKMQEMKWEEDFLLEHLAVWGTQPLIELVQMAIASDEKKNSY